MIGEESELLSSKPLASLVPGRVRNKYLDLKVRKMGVIRDPRFRNISSPITNDMLAPLGERCQIIQFCRSLREDEYKKLAEFLRSYPSITLRVYGNYDKKLDDLGFLRHFHFVKKFQVDVYDVKSFDDLSNLPVDLQYLGLGMTKSKAYSLRLLERFPDLEELYIEGHRKDFDSVSGLTKLQKLTLRSITLPDLSVLTSLKELWSLDIKLGGTKDLSHLPEIGQLKYIELWMIRGLSNIQSISDVSSLQFLFLQALRRVEELPSFRMLHKLRRLHIETLKGLVDISPIVAAPALKELLVLGTPQLKPEEFRCLVGHPTLETATISLGSINRNEAANRIVGLPRTPYGKDDEFDFQ